jgi:hypothetical protein
LFPFQIGKVYKPLQSDEKLLFKSSFHPAVYCSSHQPGANVDELQRIERKPAFRILKNSTEMQAVITSDASAGGIVFYKAGEINQSIIKLNSLNFFRPISIKANLLNFK